MTGQFENLDLNQKLVLLADKYEQASFLDSDPSQFIRWYSRPEEIEVASFIAAMLSFGSRKQFIPKIKEIFQLADKAGGIEIWLKSKKYLWDFTAPDLEKKYYRFYSYSDMQDLFNALSEILNSYGSLGTLFCDFSTKRKAEKALPMYFIAQKFFLQFFSAAAIVPKGKNSANKRIHMFLRWMVRQNSSVDVGLWNWYSPAELLIPLDVHVMEEAINLSLLPENAKASFKTAVLLTEKMSSIFPNDPARADFALFGLGVDSDFDTNLT